MNETAFFCMLAYPNKVVDLLLIDSITVLDDSSRPEIVLHAHPDPEIARTHLLSIITAHEQFGAHVGGFLTYRIDDVADWQAKLDDPDLAPNAVKSLLIATRLHGEPIE